MGQQLLNAPHLPSDEPILQRIWTILTQPADSLSQDEQSKAQMLSAVMLVFFPLGLVAAFIGPILTLINRDVPNDPVPTQAIFGLAGILVAYAISRTKHYSWGAWLTVLIPIAAILYPILSTGVVPSITGLFYLTLAVVLSGLLLSSRDTLIIGVALCVVILMLPEVEGATNENQAAFTLMLITTVLTGLVGRNREYYVRLLEQSEANLRDLNQNLEQQVEARTKDLKQARDKALVAQRVAQENSRLKSEFLSMMSHELRTPMNAIEGFTGILLNRMARVEINDKAERYITKIQSNSRRLLGLINDFLDLSRIESGRLELAHSPMSPSKMADQWRDNISSLADNKDLDFEISVDPTLPEMIYGDEEALSKIAINLIGNAIKFTEEGSVSVKLEKRDEQLALEVTDTGIGIPPHSREFIFEEFRQVDMSSKRKHGGTGLGLSIVSKLAREMGGSVSLDSELGVGSTFTVLLPIQKEMELV